MPKPAMPLGLARAIDVFGDEHYVRVAPNLDYWGGTPRTIISGAHLYPARTSLVNDHIAYINVLAQRAIRVMEILSRAEVILHLHRRKQEELYSLEQIRMEMGATAGMLMQHLKRLRHDEEIFDETYQTGLLQAHKFWMVFRLEDLTPKEFEVKRITRIEIGFKAYPRFIWQADQLICEGARENLRQLWLLEPESTKDWIKSFVNVNAWTRPCIPPWHLSKAFLDRYLFTRGYPWDWQSASTSMEESSEDDTVDENGNDVNEAFVDEAQETPM